VAIDTHGHRVGSHAAHGPEGDDQRSGDNNFEKGDLESLPQNLNATIDDSAAAQIIGVFILEFGVVLHRYDATKESIFAVLTQVISVLIGLTLAVDSNFIVLFVVIIFHRTLRSAWV
jgi:solute carrier family 39 (zinc transporter), member 1/2/3